MNPLDLKLPVSPGDVLPGKYRVDRVLGAGGMGVVVAATHEDLDQKVAIKLLLPTMLENADLVRRFLREGRAAAKLKSEHVAKVIDVGRLETGAPYMVLEYLDGGDLSEVLKSEGPLPVDGGALHFAGDRGRGRGSRRQDHPPGSQAAEPLPHPPRER